MKNGILHYTHDARLAEAIFARAAGRAVAHAPMDKETFRRMAQEAVDAAGQFMETARDRGVLRLDPIAQGKE